MDGIQAFRDIANNTSVSDSRYVYFANGKEEGADNAIAEKQTLCFNAAGKPREFSKPTGIERKQDWALMRQKLYGLVADKLGGTDSTAFKEIEKELFGKLVDGRYDLKAAEKPLRKRDVAKVLTMMDKAIYAGVDKEGLKAALLDKAKFGLRRFLKSGDVYFQDITPPEPTALNVIGKIWNTRVNLRLDDGANEPEKERVPFVPEDRKGEAERVLADLVNKVASKPLPLGDAEIAKLEKKFISDMEKAGLLGEEQEYEKSICKYNGKEVTGMAALKREVAKNFFERELAPILKGFDLNSVQAVSPDKKATAMEQMKFLTDVASYTFGKHEGAKGGNGYMGITDKGDFVKYLTHSDERKAFADGKNAVREDVRDFVNRSTDNLRNKLLELAGSVDKGLKGRVENLLKVETKANGVQLLSRANVAKAINEISKSFVGADNAKFSWDGVKHASTCPDSTLRDVYRSVALKFPKTLNLVKHGKNRMVPEGFTVVNDSPGGSTGAMILEKDGFKFVFKQSSMVSKEHVESEAKADQAYRSAGIKVPDCKTYVVGGKVYKIAQFLGDDGNEAVSLGDWMEDASEEKKAQMRKELLKGYPLDALFGNWDVVGLSKDNILVLNDKPWRIDNGSAFKFRATGPLKAPASWDERMFPDEWRTLRTGSNNRGLFDEFTAHDIWHAAGEIDFDDLVSKMPKDILTRPFLHCVSVMKDMVKTCQDLEAAGKAPEEISQALESHYDELKANRA